MANLILRIITKVGRLRFDASTDETLDSLRGRLAKHLNVKVEDLALTRDEKGTVLVTGDTRRLGTLNLSDGDILYVQCRSKMTMPGTTVVSSSETTTTGGDVPSAKSPKVEKGVASSELMHPSGQKDSPMSSESGGGGLVSPPSSGQTGGASTVPPSGDPKFLPFEHYLKSVEFNVTGLPLSKSYKRIPIEKGVLIKIPLSETLKHQVYRHVDHVEVMNVRDMTEFVQYWRYSMGCKVQRIGYLIGYYRHDPHYKDCGIRAVVEAIYEPPQVSDGTSVDIIPDDEDSSFLPSVTAILTALGLEVIGCVFTHPERTQLLTASEAIKLAKLQWQFCHPGLHYTGYTVSTFVTMTISKDSTTGEPALNAFMVSDLGMSFIRDEVIVEDKTENNDSIILIRESAPTELAPQILESGTPVSKFDVDWLIVRVNDSAPKKVRSFFPRNQFPKLNRPEEPQLSDLRSFVKAAKGSSTREKYGDFHFLLYLARILGLEVALTLCDCIRHDTNLPVEFESLISSI